MRVNNLFSEEGVFSSPAVKQSPVHAQIPDQRVEGAYGGEDNQQVEEHVSVCVALLWKTHTNTHTSISCLMETNLSSWDEKIFENLDVVSHFCEGNLQLIVNNHSESSS